MSSKIFKLSAIATFVIAATNANAALYQVVEVSTSSLTSAEEFHASAIAPSDGTTNCFETSCSSSDYTLAGDTLNATEGFSYKEEVPFGIDNHFYYLDKDDLESYCDGQLKYSTCDSWAYNRWWGDQNNSVGGLKYEREAFYNAAPSSNHTAFSETFNNLSFIPDAGVSAPSGITYQSGTEEKVVNKLDTNGYVIGNTSSGFYSYGSNNVQLFRHRGYFASGASSATILTPEPDTEFATSDEQVNLVNQMGRTTAFDSFTYDSGAGDVTYIVGSASVAPFDFTDSDKEYYSTLRNCASYDDPALYAACQNFGFASRAFIWDSSSPETTRFSVSDWATAYANYDEATAQASVRAAVIAERSDSIYDTLPVLVGYNTSRDGNNMLMEASVFRPTDTSAFSVAENAWTSTRISNATVEISGDYTHTNSVATGINKNLVVIGEAKLRGDTPQNGSAANRMFIANANDETPTAVYFTTLSESIFFSGAGGNAHAINNYNEIVGDIDAETHREINGKQRRSRGYIFPYNDTSLGTDSDRRAVFGNQAWWLDNLTNGDNGDGKDFSTNNNKYRIISASDINDAGVISATALKCASGYDSTSHFSYCGGGSETETIVAVKLIPIEGATSSNIVQRSDDDGEKVTREGAGLGWLSIGLLGLLGLRRRK